MKVTRKRLRKLIREAIKKEPLFDPVAPEELDPLYDEKFKEKLVDAVVNAASKITGRPLSRNIAEKILILLDTGNPKDERQVQAWLKSFGLDLKDLLKDLKKQLDVERNLFLSGQETHANSVLVDQFVANITDPAAEFGNPGQALGNIGTKISEAWKQKFLNNPAAQQDLEVRLQDDVIYVYSSDPELLKLLKDGIFMHQNFGESAAARKQQRGRYSGRHEKVGGYNLYDPFQNYRVYIGFKDLSGEYSNKYEDIRSSENFRNDGPTIPGKYVLPVQIGGGTRRPAADPSYAYRASMHPSIDYRKPEKDALGDQPDGFLAGYDMYDKK